MKDHKLTKEEFEAFEGLDYSYEKMQEEIEKTAPKCHFTIMNLEVGEDESWWECEHCGHTREA